MDLNLGKNNVANLQNRHFSAGKGTLQRKNEKTTAFMNVLQTPRHRKVPIISR